MSMHFFVSDRVILLFDFWNVHSVAGMALTAMAVLFITVFYEILKVELVKLDKKMLDLMTETPNTRAETLETQPIISNQQNASGKRGMTAGDPCTTFLALLFLLVFHSLSGCGPFTCGKTNSLYVLLTSFSAS
uniref:protein SLC31A2 isoform X3 n=1 Tax=Pristiophorus japonicus TaxID=55135 RepID=UPI00398F6542